MNFLLDRWRRTTFHAYFVALDPIDRATFWCVVGLVLVIGLGVSAVIRADRDRPDLRLAAPPFDLRLAAAAAPP
jgi:hypothetical protein